MTQKYFVSAYATASSLKAWDGALETAFFQGLARSPQVVGIELPWLPDREIYPMKWLCKNIPSHWSLQVTTLPAIMQLAQQHPKAGLASISEPDRRRAVALVQKMRLYVEEIERLFERSLVKSIHLYSSPTNSASRQQGSKEALQRSLVEIIAMDWGGSVLNLEHCDAWTPNHSAEKGFLSLAEEIETLQSVGGIGLILNWGRSAIEGRSLNGPLQHIREALAHRLLCGFVFSGCTDDPNSPYGAWKDSHMPPSMFCPESLLGEKEMTQVFELLKNEELSLGVKVSNRCSTKNSQNAIALNLETIAMLEAAKRE